MTVQRLDWNYTKQDRNGIVASLRVLLWRLWRKPTREELYRWLVAEYGGFCRPETQLEKNLSTLVKMDLLHKEMLALYQRISIEHALLAKDIEEAKKIDIDVNWITSRARDIIKYEPRTLNRLLRD